MNNAVSQFESVFLTLAHETLVGDFPFVPRPNLIYADNPKFDQYELVNHLKGFANTFFAELNGQDIPEEISSKLVSLAADYMRGYPTHEKIRTDPVTFVCFCRLKALISTIEFLATPCAIEVLLQFRHLDGRTPDPWGFEMFVDYKNVGGGFRYVLKEGIDGSCIQGLHRVILCDKLWYGRCHEMHRVLFASIGQVLKHLSHEQGLIAETAQARADLLTKNHNGEDHHEPHCSAGFWEDELKQLRKLATSSDSLQRSTVDLIIANEFMMNRPHCC